MSNKKNSFEENLNSLELIVNQLETGDLSLDDALVKFEQGIKLAKQSQKQLKNAEQKIKILLTEDEDEELNLINDQISIDDE